MKTIVVYNTVTGNTEVCAQWIHESLAEGGHQVVIKDTDEVYPSVLEDYDLIIMGVPTYGEGELTYDFEQFLQGMELMDLSGKKAAVFGLGDSESYPDDFCTAADTLVGTLKKCGATLITDSLKIDGDPEESEDDVRDWAAEINEIARRN